MKDAFTATYSDLVQNQIELGSTLQSIIDEAVQRGVSTAEIDRVRSIMESFNVRTNYLAALLTERYQDQN
ncbi:hypothetical protein IFT80_21405 [Pseudomonas sp. CFBP 8771]|uniref:hypothetical protein n=1 Tax=Pseudomonas sp. CFBP 8771 TaxID=2775285 RepID=UPI0017849CA7|nr:hypothetical protein [Pseudomonas sp. CFBP 8771]MBD8605195.1 hypothetical protein [Pseudomonas sp. CFBP 8771]